MDNKTQEINEFVESVGNCFECENCGALSGYLFIRVDYLNKNGAVPCNACRNGGSKIIAGSLYSLLADPNNRPEPYYSREFLEKIKMHMNFITPPNSRIGALSNG